MIAVALAEEIAYTMHAGILGLYQSKSAWGLMSVSVTRTHLKGIDRKRTLIIADDVHPEHFVSSC